jgi:hypothetical protein
METWGLKSKWKQTWRLWLKLHHRITLGDILGAFYFFTPHLIPIRYPPTIMGKNEKQWKKSWISTLCNALGCKHHLNCAHFSSTPLPLILVMLVIEGITLHLL